MTETTVEELRFVGRRLTGGDLHEQIIGAAQEFCRRHGEDPGEVAWSEWDRDEDGDPVVRFAIYLENEDGRRYIDPETGGVAITTRVHPLIGEWPHWWIASDRGWFLDHPETKE